nr:hypothetical protein CFP56_64298 [Quercus suber]
MSPKRRGAWLKRRRSVVVRGRSVAVLAPAKPKSDAWIVASTATAKPKSRCARAGEAEKRRLDRRLSVAGIDALATMTTALIRRY